MNLSELGKNPIRPDAPAGDDVRYDPEFEELQKEIDKLAFAAGGGGVDWRRVSVLAASILEKKSKNLQVATYLAAALIELQKLEGFSTGTGVLKDLIGNFWEDLYPPAKRMRGRINAMTWWMDRAEAFFKAYEPDTLPAAIVGEARDRVSGLDRIFSEKCDEAPMLSRLNDYLNRLPVAEEALPEPEPPAIPATPEPAAPEPATKPGQPVQPTEPAASKPMPAPRPVSPPAAPETPQTRQDVEKLIESGLASLDNAATYLLKQDLADPLPFRLARQAAWLSVDRLPMADGRQTVLPPPEPAIRMAIDNLISGREYEAAVNACESRIREFLFWLDLSRLASQALEGMGPRFRAAAQAVALETAFYAARLSGIENLTFSDGTPFADAETRAWLNTISLGPGQPMEGAGCGGPDAEIAEAQGQAQELIRDKRPEEALRLLGDRMARSMDGRARLLWRSVLVHVLVQLGRADLARPHIMAILERVGAVDLEQWDRESALRGLRAAREGLKDADDEDGRIAALKVLEAIARLDPAEALKITAG